MPTGTAELFEPFRRGSDSRIESVRGSGLGLSIVRSIAEAHGGTVGAHPVSGGGLAVEVDLPRLSTAGARSSS